MLTTHSTKNPLGGFTLLPLPGTVLPLQLIGVHVLLVCAIRLIRLLRTCTPHSTNSMLRSPTVLPLPGTALPLQLVSVHALLVRAI